MRHFLATMLSVLMLFAFACSCEKTAPPSTTGEPTPEEKIQQAYALLYSVSKPAQKVDQITKIKKTTPAIEKILEDIGAANTKIVAALEAWTRNDTEGVLAHMDLPAFEQKSRDIITRRTTVKLLLSGKKESIKRLLLAQFQALQYQNALLTIIENNAREKGRDKQAAEFRKTIKDLENRVFDQITIVGQEDLQQGQKKAEQEEKKAQGK